jgi:hypothetical protein
MVIHALDSHIVEALSGCEDLLGCPLDDTAGDGEVGAVLEVQIDLASGLTTLVDAPDESVSECGCKH